MKERVVESINAYLGRTGKSQQMLASELKVNKAQVTRYLNRESLPCYDSLKELADVLGVSPSYFSLGLMLQKIHIRNS